MADLTEDELMTHLLRHVEDGNMEMTVREDGEPMFRLTEQGLARAKELERELFGAEDGQHRVHRQEYEGNWTLP